MGVLNINLFSWEAALFGILIFIVIYIWFQHKFSYWSQRTIQGPKPVFPFGNLKEVLRRKEQFFQPYIDSYSKYNQHPYVGLYCFHRPVLCINDPELAKLVLIKDFDHFQAHGIFSEGSSDPLAGHMFNIHGEKWKNLRLKMSPVFSPGKLKTTYPLVESIAEDSIGYLNSSSSDTFNFSEFYEKYTMGIIASVGFGIECNSFKNPDAEFLDWARQYFVPKSAFRNFIRAIAFIAPDLSETLGIRRFGPGMTNFFYGLVTETAAYREKHSYWRNDFVQMLIELKNQNDDDGNEKFKFNMADLAANTMLYMAAGYETSATVGQFAIYELALNPEIQEKARKEVEEVLARHEGKCTYEAQNEMTYLNMVFDETMRKYPPMRALFRRCNKDYQLDDNLLIEKGTLVFVPVHAIHMDPKIHPDPERFDPDRFLPERKAAMHRCHWLPFGEGPRKCLGLRQGYIQVKIALVKILQRYRLVLDERTSVPMKIKTTCLSFAADSGIWVKLEPLQGKSDRNNN